MEWNVEWNMEWNMEHTYYTTKLLIRWTHPIIDELPLCVCLTDKAKILLMVVTCLLVVASTGPSHLA